VVDVELACTICVFGAKTIYDLAQHMWEVHRIHRLDAPEPRAPVYNIDSHGGDIFLGPVTINPPTPPSSWSPLPSGVMLRVIAEFRDQPGPISGSFNFNLVPATTGSCSVGNFNIMASGVTLGSVQEDIRFQR
jgi:hypothetical protein